MLEMSFVKNNLFSWMKQKCIEWFRHGLFTVCLLSNKNDFLSRAVLAGGRLCKRERPLEKPARHADEAGSPFCHVNANNLFVFSVFRGTLSCMRKRIYECST